MSIILDGTLGITSPAWDTVQGNLTTTGNTILGDASTDTLNVGNGGLVKDASGNVGIGTASPAGRLDVTGANVVVRSTASSGYAGFYASGATGQQAYNFFAINGTETARIWSDANNYITFATGASATTQARINSAGLLQFNSGYGSAATAYGCRAWVNFNGTGTVAIRASGNVSSITDTGTGQYTVNFTTAMVDVNYTMIGTASWTVATNQCYVDEESYSMSTHLVGSIAIGVRQTATTLNDAAGVYVAIFR